MAKTRFCLILRNNIWAHSENRNSPPREQSLLKFVYPPPWKNKISESQEVAWVLILRTWRNVQHGWIQETPFFDVFDEKRGFLGQKCAVSYWLFAYWHFLNAPICYCRDLHNIYYDLRRRLLLCFPHSNYLRHELLSCRPYSYDLHRRLLLCRPHSHD